MQETPLQRGHSRLINTEEAALHLGVTPRYVRRLVSERRIGFYKVGKFVRFDPTELDLWLSDRYVRTVN